jgi:carbon monoxide dehydrogenase subunit G
VADASYTTTTRLSVEVIWAFVQDMDNWARFVTGYQSHEKRSDTESCWTLKGDLGVLSRALTFEVLITEWRAPSQVRFTLRGLNEPMSGEGAFTIESQATGASTGTPAPGPATPAAKGFLARWLEALARWLLGLVGGRAERAAPTTAAAGESLSTMRFRLRLDPGGPMAPMVNAMITPLLLPAAEQLADKILAHLEAPPAGASEGAPR